MKIIYTLLVTSLLFFAAAGCSRCDQATSTKQKAMVERQIHFRGITNERILEAMRTVPRAEFVLPEYRSQAYDDLEAPIGKGETLNRPYEDALILESLSIKPSDRVLEVGTGTGYFASLLSKLASKVFTIEIVEDFGKQAQENIKRLGYNNVEVKIGDGFLGWEEHAPFDAIVLNCSPADIPKPLEEQLAEGGRLLLPLGGEEKFQELLLYTKKDGKLELERRIAPATFVPMKGKAKEQQPSEE